MTKKLFDFYVQREQRDTSLDDFCNKSLTIKINQHYQSKKNPDIVIYVSDATTYVVSYFRLGDIAGNFKTRRMAVSVFNRDYIPFKEKIVSQEVINTVQYKGWTKLANKLKKWWYNE